ncbi:hypothetical protein [Sansalvadorimonas verongulae]|uniref:hypothetical protein n=1 Tax=Sansalvadorimonas verongulae TaxID=2172824 RepID=UPI0012BD3E9A|nr:hypothetical protein [Sansalvadorimonas verongulae]
MDAFVGGECTGLDKRLVASIEVTDKRPVLCVDALVSDECTGLVESLVAPVKVTDKGP